MSNDEREKFNQLVDDKIAYDRANPCPERHTARWARIIEIDNHLKAIILVNANTRPKKNETPYHETDEWKRLANEGNLLESIERTYALEIDWPVWQAGQHFQYLETDNSIREGEVITFNIDAETVECTTWPSHDFHGFVNSKGSRQYQTIKVSQIHDAEIRKEELELARQAVAAQAQLAEDKIRLPLFADQITLAQ